MSTSFYRYKSGEELTFTTKCHELDGLNFGDKTTKMIYNASACEREKDIRREAIAEGKIRSII